MAEHQQQQQHEICCDADGMCSLQKKKAVNVVEQQGEAVNVVEQRAEAVTGVEQRGETIIGVEQQVEAVTGNEQRAEAVTGVEQRGETIIGVEQQGEVPKSQSSRELFPNLLANHSTCRKFCALYEECLSTISETFPECKLTSQEFSRFVADVKGHEEHESSMIKQWHKDMSLSQLYARADHHDNTLWEKMPLFNRIDVLTKIRDPDMNEESIGIIWEYVDGMNRHARMYNAIPTNLFDNIQTQAMQYKDKIQNGELSLETMNWSDIQTMGEKLMGSINQSDVAELTSNLSGLAQSYKIQNLDDIFKMMADIPGLGESTQNLNTAGVTSIIEQAMSGFGGGGGGNASSQQQQSMPPLSGMMAAFGQMMRDSNTTSRQS